MGTLPQRPTEQWLVRPLDADTNENIARELARTGDVDEVETELGGMYRCSYAKITTLVNSAKKFNLRFEVYRKRTKNSQLEYWEFGHKKLKARKSKKYQQAKKQMNKKK